MPVIERVTTPYELHKGYVLAVLSRRCGWLDAGDREGFFHDAYEVMLEKQSSGQLDVEAMHERELRAYLTQTALFKALAEGRRAERRLTTELDDNAAARPDAELRLEERVATEMEGAPVREIVAELPARQQAIVKLRFYFERSPAEIQKVLGITERTYRRQLERAMKKVAERYDVVRSGRWCESHHGLIIAYVSGLAKPERARQARNHLASCTGCARMAADLREATRRAAALLPFPISTVTADGPLTRLSEAIVSVRDWVGDLVHGAGRQLASLSGRADPSLVQYGPAARPGAMVASLTACIAIGGGATYCAVQGVPDSVRALLGAEKEVERDRPEPKPEPAIEPTDVPTIVPEVAPVPPSTRGPAPAPQKPEGPRVKPRDSGPRDSSPRSEAAPETEPEQTPTVPDPEFSPEAPLPPASSGGGAPSSPAPDGPQGEFDL